MMEKVQLVSDLTGIVQVARVNSALVDLGTLVGTRWGLGGVDPALFEAAVLSVPDPDVLLRLTGTSLQFLDSATGTVEYSVLEVPDIGA